MSHICAGACAHGSQTSTLDIFLVAVCRLWLFSWLFAPGSLLECGGLWLVSEHQESTCLGLLTTQASAMFHCFAWGLNLGPHAVQ